MSFVNAFAGFGKAYSVMSFIFASIFMAIFIFVGIILVRKKDLYTKNIEGIILDVKSTNDQDGKFNESLEIQYIVGEKTYERLFAIETSIYYKKGQNIRVYYNPHDPNDAVIQKAPTKLIGWGLIGFGTVIILLALVQMIFSFKNKGVAMLTGAEGIANIF